MAVGLESKRNYPPQCCDTINFSDVKEDLSKENLKRWSAVQEEFEDVSPVYCAVKTCSRYLSKSTYDRDRQWASCDQCSDTKTCTVCTALETDHQGDSCPQRLTKLNQEPIQKEGWKSCPRCKHAVEKV